MVHREVDLEEDKCKETNVEFFPLCCGVFADE